MPTAKLWQALQDLADAWQHTGSVARFTRDLPKNAVKQSEGLSAALQELHAAAGGLMNNPLLISSALPAAASLWRKVDLRLLHSRHEDWFDAAFAVERGHRATVAWLRARLHGYPLLPAPQLVPGGPLTTDEFTYRVIWQPGERGQRLHFQDVPNIGELLRADAAADRVLRDSTRRVAQAFKETPEWTALAVAHEALDQEARSELGAARLLAQQRLRQEAVDAHEPNRALRRAVYREAVIRETVQGLSGAAEDYAKAFQDADGLVELAASSIFGQVVCYPIETLTVTELEVTPGPVTTVNFAASESIFGSVNAGSVVWLADPLMRDALHVTGLSVSFDSRGSSVRMKANVLDGTGDGWR